MTRVPRSPIVFESLIIEILEREIRSAVEIFGWTMAERRCVFARLLVPRAPRPFSLYHSHTLLQVQCEAVAPRCCSPDALSSISNLLHRIACVRAKRRDKKRRAGGGGGRTTAVEMLKLFDDLRAGEITR